MTSREQFEEWCINRLISVTRMPGCDSYQNPKTRGLWSAWQASREAIEQGAIAAYQDDYGNALSESDFNGGADEMHETAFSAQWTPLIKADGLKVKK